MPLVQVTMVEGRSSDKKKELIRRVTDAVVKSIGADPRSVRVAIYEIPKSHWGVNGITKDDEEQ